MLPLSVMAQSVTYNHDESVMNQFTIGETGAGSFTPDWYYDVLHIHHTHEGSIGNLCNEQIQMLMQQTFDDFHFERMLKAEKNLLG